MSEQEMGIALDMKGVSKRFPGTIAVDDVSFQVYAGEVHALVGENGAGKSTLMKILAGSFNDYTGEIFINKKKVQLHTPFEARRNGIGMVYQELSLARPISIAENLLAGRLPTKRGFVDRKALYAESKHLLAMVGLDIDPWMPVEDISQHEAQLVEIARVLGAQPCILVMDEPTSALSNEEVERLFGLIRNLKKAGIAIVYISHHLPEIFKIADRVTVMRDGKKVATKGISDVSHTEIVQMMVGRSIKEFYNREERQISPEIRFKVSSLTRYGFFNRISFEVKKGEILGICGLSGAGRSELARALVGLDHTDEGTIELDGQQVKSHSMASRVEQGIAYLTEDRKTEGLAFRLPVDDNIMSPIIHRYSKFSVYSKRKGMPAVNSLINELAIYPPDPTRVVGNLSGGNQQKVLLAKWLASSPKVLILDEPTRGVDIGAKTTIHKTIGNLAKDGTSIILISSDLPELVSLSDRVMVMVNGKFTREMKYEECTEESVLLAANGEGGK
ncbi:MAG: sugar ABC transporter ATP-binding protein [Spirochaetaceae bacterium]|nr:sugar ABC transporter ATP-binding protein [Spirochaetaceae bacterium]